MLKINIDTTDCTVYYLKAFEELFNMAISEDFDFKLKLND